MLTVDSKYAITVTKESDRKYFVHLFSLQTFDMKFEEIYGGIEDVSYIKLKDI
jgi:hypothetical protein